MIKNKTLKRLPVAILALLSVFIIGGCSPVKPANGDTLKIIASITPVADFIKQVGGDKVEVTIMVPAGASPHSYEPSTGQMVAVSEANIFVKVGSGVDYEVAWMDKIIGMNKEMLIVDCSKGIEIVNGDPHIWTSPLNAKQMVQNIYNGLISEDPANKDYYKANYENYIAELNDLHDYIGKIFEGYQNRSYLIYHPSFGYFSSLYGLNQIPIEQEGKEPTPKIMQHSIDQATEYNLNYVYADPQSATSYAEAIAKGISGSVLYIDPLPSSYISSMRDTANSLALEFE
ncbi:MAG: zinc ABC transporter substrate-binding protein [Dehalococcoidales bacterium]